MKINIRAVIAIVMMSTAGCAGTDTAIRQVATNTRSDVFRQETLGASAGAAVLEVSASIKTHSTKYHILEPGTRGKDSYSIIINVDGQAIELRAVPRQEERKDPARADVEGGYGMRYDFRKTLVLPPGKHVVKVAVPEDEIVLEREIVLFEGKNDLVLKPVYGKIPKEKSRLFGFATDRRFTEELESLQPVLNSKEL